MIRVGLGLQTAFWAFIALVITEKTPGMGLFGGTKEFFDTIDPLRSQGAIVFKRTPLKTNDPPWLSICSWQFGQLVIESGVELETKAANNPFILSNPLSSSGRWNGTNWSYTSGYLVFISHISGGSELANLTTALRGRMPEEWEFETLVGRGFTLEDLSSLIISGNFVTGRYHGIPIRGSIIRGPGVSEFDFTFHLVGSSVWRRHRVTLQPFPTGGYLPSHLIKWVADAGTTNIENEYQVLAVSAEPVVPTFSPFMLYSNATVVERAGERFFVTEGRTKREISDRHPQVNHAPRQLFFILSAIVTSLLLICWISLRKHGKLTNRKSEVTLQHKNARR